MEYADEPPLVFSPLSEEDYCRFYRLEMDAFGEDAGFYLSRLRTNHHVLELGCGSGRLTRLLAGSCKAITAVDISSEMIRLAGLQPLANVSYHRQDMLEISFGHQFDVIVIPYNTLNLLGSAWSVSTCLRLCRHHLAADGRLLLHLYHPDARLLESQGEKFFQFAIHNLADGGKLIKETLKSYNGDSELLTLEERYRDRPQKPGSVNRDLRRILTLFAPQLRRWQSLLHDSGFSAPLFHGDFDGAPFIAGTTALLVDASP